MNTGWQPIDTPNTADQVSRSACWDDYPLVDWIFCRSAIILEGDAEAEGQALRILAEAWGQPGSHVEIALFDFQSPVALPLPGDFLKVVISDSDRLAVYFSRSLPASTCESGFFRFLDLSAPAAARLYRHPSVLARSESALAAEGFAEYAGEAGERLIIAGEDSSPTLWASDAEGHSSKINLTPAMSNWLLEALHSVGLPKSEQGGDGDA